jgi:ribosomal protein L7Ae-like RNA K-turn-binding protein
MLCQFTSNSSNLSKNFHTLVAFFLCFLKKVTYIYIEQKLMMSKMCNKSHVIKILTKHPRKMKLPTHK